MRYLRLMVAGLFLGIWLLLAACNTSTSNSNDFFTKDKEWTQDIPSDAEIVSPEEFQKRVEAGELDIITPAVLEAQEQARQKEYQDNIAFLQNLPDKSSYLTDLLESAAAMPSYEADRSMVMSDGQTVLLLGVGVEIASAVESYKALHSVENVLDDYTMTYNLMPDTLKAQAATPDSLKGKSLAEVQTALANLDTLLGTLSETALDGVKLETNTTTLLQPQATPIAGAGTDIDVICKPPIGLVSQFWFPLKNFISPIKWQGGRGTCWAFAAIGAIESRERVQNDNPVNLSEQFFVNKVKQDWDSSDNMDGYWPEKALKEAADHNQALPTEDFWTYNQSVNRSSETDYANSCDDKYKGDCSNTAHQSRRVCTKRLIGKNCGNVTYKFTGSGVAASRVTYLWESGEDRFDLNRYRLLLSQGHVLIATFPVYPGFRNAASGFVTDYTTTKNPAFHVVQIVGFISNQELARQGLSSNIGGGGYFIIKNSGGCKTGDAGYFYIPAQYVDTLFTSLSSLNLDTKRGEVWNYDQAGGTLPATIEIKTNPVRVDLGVSINLADFFKVTHPIATSVNLSVSDRTDGKHDIHSGGWTIRGGFPPSLPYTFKRLGKYKLELIATTNKVSTSDPTFPASTVTATLNVDVVNTPPSIDLLHDGKAYQGEDFPITAFVRDRNETDGQKLCLNTKWSVDAPDTRTVESGCETTVRFGTTGSRVVTVTVTDSNGQTTRQTLVLAVQPPPPNPYPRITSYGVYDCNNLAATSGSTIDLTNKSCLFLAKATVENLSSETLSYDWTLYVEDPEVGKLSLTSAIGSSSSEFSLDLRKNSGPATNSCYVEVKVNAPDASRSKSRTVWTGRCTYYTFSVN